LECVRQSEGRRSQGTAFRRGQRSKESALLRRQPFPTALSRPMATGMELPFSASELSKATSRAGLVPCVPPHSKRRFSLLPSVSGVTLRPFTRMVSTDSLRGSAPFSFRMSQIAASCGEPQSGGEEFNSSAQRQPQSGGRRSERQAAKRRRENSPARQGGELDAMRNRGPKDRHLSRVERSPPSGGMPVSVVAFVLSCAGREPCATGFIPVSAVSSTMRRRNCFGLAGTGASPFPTLT
jgi:hypothetical protein